MDVLPRNFKEEQGDKVTVSSRIVEIKGENINYLQIIILFLLLIDKTLNGIIKNPYTLGFV
jgi:hypothetical protein